MTTLTRTGTKPGQPAFSPSQATPGRTAAEYVRRERAYGARNYDPLPVVISQGEGSWLTDVEGRRYLDLMSAYSAVSFGHAHPKIVAAFTEQAHRLAVTSRAYFNDRLPLLLEKLVAMTGLDRALPVNTGLEAVETAIKASRKWAHKVKGVPEGHAEIIACRGNFHGRSITITGLSTEPQYRDGFGPYPSGLKTVPYDDPAALDAAIGPNTAAFLVEPVQGEAGIVVPKDGYLAEVKEICRRRRVLLICDEVQTGLGRTGHTFGWQHDGAMPDGVILGKALGGGLMPVSAFVATDDVMQVFHPGDHGSTFGGNPLGAAAALAALEVLEDERLVARSRELGEWLLHELRRLDSPLVTDVRGRGLFIGIEVDPARTTARQVVDKLLVRGILSKDTHGTVIRIAPPLNVPREALVWAIGEIRAALRDVETGRREAA